MSYYFGTRINFVLKPAWMGKHWEAWFSEYSHKMPTDLGSESKRRLLWVQDISWSWERLDIPLSGAQHDEPNFGRILKHPFHGTYRMASSRCHGADFPGDLNVLRLRSLHFPSTLLGRSSWHQPGDSLCWCSIMDKSPENWLSFERPFLAVIVPKMRKNVITWTSNYSVCILICIYFVYIERANQETT